MTDKHRQMPRRFDPLVTYNGELARGLVHTKVWEEQMAVLQRDFYDWAVESARVRGDEDPENWARLRSMLTRGKAEATDDDLVGRISEAEAVIRAQGRLIEAMYNSDLERGWPKEASELRSRYEERYGVDLAGETDG